MDITRENLKNVKKEILDKYLKEEEKNEKTKELAKEANKLMLKFDSSESKEEVEIYE